MAGRTRWRGLIALFVVAALAFTACSSGSSSGGGSDDTAGGGGSPSDPNGVVKVGYDLQQEGGEIEIDPTVAKAGALPNDPLYYMIYGRFLQPHEDGTLSPDLAESVDLVDTTTIRINLRPDGKFSDGSPFDATAVKAYFDEVIAKRSQNETAFLPAFYDLASVTVENPATVVLSIPGGTAASWYDSYIPIWTSSVVKVPVADPNKPIGAGPFKIDDYKPGESLTLSKNENYWRADDVLFAGLDLQQVAFAQPATGISAIQAGQLDMSFSEPSLINSMSGDVTSFARTSPNKNVWMHFCKSSGPMADPRVRVAINKALDREAISEAVYEGTASASVQLWPNDHRLANPDLDETLSYDPDGAKELLAEAGYANGLEVQIFPIQAFNLDETAEVMQGMFADVGITATIVPTTDYVSQYLQNTPPNGIGLYPGNAAGAAKLNAFTGASLGNVCKYENAELTGIINQIKTVSEASDEAVELWHEAADIIVPEALGGFVLWRSELTAYDASRLGDFEVLAGGDFLLPDPFVTYVKKGS
jgi:peptide/nickel transport system substrate-binding protein